MLLPNPLFYVPDMPTERMKSAWLVTWEHTGKSITPTKKKIAAIFNPRLSPDTVRRMVELIYINFSPSIAGRIVYLKNRKTNPYPAEFDKVDGVSVLGRIHCGRNPWLFARIVDDLCVKVDNSFRESVSWKERPRPRPVTRP
jgi:hypothetical protein